MVPPFRPADTRRFLRRLYLAVHPGDLLVILQVHDREQRVVCRYQQLYQGPDG